MAVDVIARMMAMGNGGGTSDAYTKAQTDALLGTKVDKETGKGLSTNDYTTAEKDKLEGIASGAEVNVQSDWSQSDSSADDYIKNKPTIQTVNDATLTIQKNGTAVGTFSANAATAATINITVPVDAEIASLVDRGAKNHINYTLTTIKNMNTAGTWNGNIYSINNVTYTVNDDMTITANGTATGNASLVLKKFDPQELIGYAGYILSGCPTGGSEETYRLEIQRAGSPWTRYAMNYGEGVQIPDVGDSFTYQTQCFLTMGNGATVSSLTFKPMICSMEDYEASPEFVPYAPSNRELYEMILALQNAQNGG